MTEGKHMYNLYQLKKKKNMYNINWRNERKKNMQNIDWREERNYTILKEEKKTCIIWIREKKKNII